MATGRSDSHKVKFLNGFFSSLKCGFYFNVFTLAVFFAFFGFSKILFIESEYPTNKEIGFTINNAKLKGLPLPYDYLVIENFQRNKDYLRANRLINLCNQKGIPCFNHRLILDDYDHFYHNPYYYLDDWWLDNCRYKFISGWDFPLKQELSRLKPGTVVVFNEHKFNSIHEFILYFTEIRDLYPDLHFIIGVQVHLQWFDLKFFNKLSIIHQIDNAALPWMISEFSIYDRLYKPWRTSFIDDWIPLEFRRVFQNYQAYWISRQCGKSLNCRGLTLWASNRDAWFKSMSRLPDYKGQFLIYQDDQPTPLYWAIRRGLSSGESSQADSKRSSDPEQ